MLITPRPGADPGNILHALGGAQLAADNLRGSHRGRAHAQLMAYLEWATEAAGSLRHQVRDADIDRLVLTRRYQALLGSCGSLAGSSQERLVNGLGPVSGRDQGLIRVRSLIQIVEARRCRPAR